MPSDSFIKNPVLRGFHPDPSILRVGSDFYIATSTFEWFPGVRLHHTRDLRHFRVLGYALDRSSQLDLRGNPRSGGVGAMSDTRRRAVPSGVHGRKGVGARLRRRTQPPRDRRAD